MDKQKLIKKLQKAADVILTVNDKLETPPAIASAIYGIVNGLADEIILECTKNDYVPIEDPYGDFTMWRRLTPAQRDRKRFVLETVPEFGSWLPETEEWKEWLTEQVRPVSSFKHCICGGIGNCDYCCAHSCDFSRTKLVDKYNKQLSLAERAFLLDELGILNTKDFIDFVDRMPSEQLSWLLKFFEKVINSKPNSPWKTT